MGEGGAVQVEIEVDHRRLLAGDRDREDGHRDPAPEHHPPRATVDLRAGHHDGRVERCRRTGGDRVEHLLDRGLAVALLGHQAAVASAVARSTRWSGRAVQSSTVTTTSSHTPPPIAPNTTSLTWCMPR